MLQFKIENISIPHPTNVAGQDDDKKSGQWAVTMDSHI